MKFEEQSAKENGCVYYLIPDIKRPSFNLITFLKSALKLRLAKYIRSKIFIKHKPIGGIKVIYQHCMLLTELGYRAVPVKMGIYEGNFFGYDITPISLDEAKRTITERDVVVASEFMPYEIAHFDLGKKAMFVQNWTNIRRRLVQSDQRKSYRDIGYQYVFSCSKYTSDLIEEMMGIESWTVTNGIDQSKFCQEKEKRINNRVLCMPRKNPDDLKAILGRIDTENAEIVMADNLTEAELIEEYQKADIFLATGYPEGFGLPPLEAMCCGCAVVGFTGGGASEFMIHDQTALVAEDGDCLEAARALDLLISDKGLKEKIREGGVEISKKYGIANTKKSLEKTFEKIFDVS